MKLLLLFLLPVFGQAQSNSGTIRGVVTYFFNKYQGDKPDIGSKVYVLDVQYDKNFSMTIYESYENEKRNGLQSIDFTAIDDENFNQLVKITGNERVNEATVDGAGNYSVSVPEGTYYVYIKSHNRNTPKTLTDGDGDSYCKMIKVFGGQTKDVSFNFPL